MMDTKLLEIRDRGTFVPMLAIRVSGADGYLMRRAGFGEVPMVYLVNLNAQQAKYDPYAWGRARTFGVAHRYIDEHWDEIANEQVIDVEFILGERAAPKASERERVPA